MARRKYISPGEIALAPKAERVYIEEGCTLKDVAERLNIPNSTVHRWSQKYKWFESRLECIDQRRKKEGLMKAGKPIKNKPKPKVVTRLRDMPDNFEKLGIVSKSPDDYQILYRAIRAGEIGAVKYSYSWFVDQIEAERLLEKAKLEEVGQGSCHAASNGNAKLGELNLHTVVTQLADLMGQQEECLQILRVLFDGDNDRTNALNDNFKVLVGAIQNLSRITFIVAASFYGLAEEMSAENKIFTKDKIRERILMVNQLLTIEEWNDGFESVAIKRNES